MAAVQRKTSRLCARAHRPLAHPAAYSHAEARKSWQRVPDSAHAWLLDLPNVKPATRGAPPRTLPMGKGPLLSPQEGGEDPSPPEGGGGVLNASRSQRNTNHYQRKSFSSKLCAMRVVLNQSFAMTEAYPRRSSATAMAVMYTPDVARI